MENPDTSIGTPIYDEVTPDSPPPWPFALYGQIQHLSWVPRDLIGIPKAEQIRRVVSHTLDTIVKTGGLKETGLEEDETRARVKDIGKKVGRKIRKEQGRTLQSKGYPKKANWLHPEEMQRRLKFFNENMLNSEFDILMSLLPNKIISKFVRDLLKLEVAKGSNWYYCGNCQDAFWMTKNIGAGFLQADGILYSPESALVIGTELKLGSKLNDLQVEKYCAGFTALKKEKEIISNCEYVVAVLSSRKAGKDDAKTVLENAKDKVQGLRKKGGKGLNGTEKKLYNLGSDLVKTVSSARVRLASWQQVGDFLDEVCRDEDVGETVRKLIDGFLYALSRKCSKEAEDDFVYRRKES